ncbi:MAG: VWA domain-containing protein [Chitinophagales bacterium]|nr:VWA domain-containing protein [Chitinophagales bacterium]
MKSTIFSLFYALFIVLFTGSCHHTGRQDMQSSNTHLFKEVAVSVEAAMSEPVPNGENPSPPADEEMNTEAYNSIQENPFVSPQSQALSTFSIDVDRASYANIRRFINDKQMPPEGSVRIEEMVNYFNYDYPTPTTEHPFGIYTELTKCPWTTDHQLLRIGIQGKKIANSQLPPNNLVFLIDVSGSMDEPNKLPLVKQALRLLVDQMRPQDHIAIVVYAGAAGLALPPTSGSNKSAIMEAISNLYAGGSTAGGEGLELAYQIAEQNFQKNGNNRIILATDGDFNVGVSSDAAMENLISSKRKSGVYLSCLGFGDGNYKDSKMETLADKGNGNYSYIDSEIEAKKVLLQEMGSTLLTIAKDVKIQVEFNPNLVQAYRLIGYENRLLAAEDFEDDTKDAGELGAGHTVTALYEIIPTGVSTNLVRKSPTLKYQSSSTNVNNSDELCTIKFRYKRPASEQSVEIVQTQAPQVVALEQASENTRFASAVALTGMLLRHSNFKGKGSYDMAQQLATQAKGNDAEGYRKEFIDLIGQAKTLDSAAK